MPFNYKHDDRLNIDGRLIHMAAGVLHAASIIDRNSELVPRREREVLEALAADLRDEAYRIRQHHDTLKKS